MELFTHARSRMRELAASNSSGSLAEHEQDELQRYLRVGAFLNSLQAKARLSLKKQVM